MAIRCAVIAFIVAAVLIVLAGGAGYIVHALPKPYFWREEDDA